MSIADAYQMRQSDTSTDGYLSSTDWNTFNNKANSGANTDITSLRNAALSVGRDADNFIDWSTDNQLDIRINSVTTSILSISTGTSDNDKLATQGYIDDAVSGEDNWDRSAPSSRGVLTPTNLGDDTKFFTSLDVTYPVRYNLYGNHDSISELWDCYYEPSDSTIRSSSANGNVIVQKIANTFQIVVSDGVAAGAVVTGSKAFIIDTATKKTSINADVDMNGYLYSVSSNVMQLQTQTLNSVSEFEVIGNGNFAGTYTATYGGDSNASVSLSANATTANMTFGSSITNGLDIAGKTTVNDTLSVKNSATSFMNVVPYSDRIEFDFGGASTNVHFNRGTNSLNYHFWGSDATDPLLYINSGTNKIGFRTNTPSGSHDVTVTGSMLVNAGGLECDTSLNVSGGTFQLPSGTTVNNIATAVGTPDDNTLLTSAAINTNGILDLTSAEVTQLANIDTTTISATQWSQLGGDGFALLAGRSSGQTLNGGTGSGEDLVLVSTSNATKGALKFESDTDATSHFGRAAFSSPTTDVMFLSHVARVGESTNYAIQQSEDGTTCVNSRTTKNLNFCISDGTKAHIDADGNFNTANGIFRDITTVSGSTYSLLINDYILHVTRTATGDCTITLPTAQVTAGRVIHIKDASGFATVYTVTVDTQGSEKIDTADDIEFGGGDSRSIYCDGTNWFTF